MCLIRHVLKISDDKTLDTLFQKNAGNTGLFDWQGVCISPVIRKTAVASEQLDDTAKKEKGKKMNKALNVMASLAAVLLSFQSHADTPPSGFPIEPSVTVNCNQSAIVFTTLAAYLTSVETYKRQVLLPSISSATDAIEWASAFGAYVSINRKVRNFLNECFVNAKVAIPYKCTPILGALNPSSPQQLASNLQGLDVSESLLYLIPLYKSPNNATVTTAFQNFYTSNLGNYCTYYGYSDTNYVTGLTPPSL